MRLRRVLALTYRFILRTALLHTATVLMIPRRREGLLGIPAGNKVVTGDVAMIGNALLVMWSFAVIHNNADKEVVG